MSRLPYALLFLLAGGAHAACWEESRNEDGSVSFRNPSRTEMVTVAFYEHRARDEGARLRVVEGSVRLRRRLERTMAAQPVRLTEVSRHASGDRLQLRYEGEEPGSDRRFVNVTVGGPGWLQNFYYEAVGLEAAEFAASAEAVFAGLAVVRRQDRHEADIKFLPGEIIPTRPARSMSPPKLLLGPDHGPGRFQCATPAFAAPLR